MAISSDSNFIDTHIHLQDFKDPYADVIESFVKQGINKLICAATKREDWEKIEKIYQDFPDNIIPAFGIHPWYVRDIKNNWAEDLEKLLIKYPHALIGETGLDRYRDEDYEPQNSIFKQHIELAKKYNRALLVHAVKCQDWLEEYWQNKLMPPKFVFHSYTARRELMKKVLDAGGYISYSSSILNNREKDKTVNATPLNRLLLETDAPYQLGNITETAQQIAEIRGENLKDFSVQIYKNSLEFIKNE